MGWQLIRQRLMRDTVQARPLWVLPALAAVVGLGACSSGGNISLGKSQVADPATVDFPIFYVKRPVPVNADGTLQQDDLRIMRTIVPPADLYMRASASPSASETNITARITAGQLWDVKDVDTSADGTQGHLRHARSADHEPADRRTRPRGASTSTSSRPTTCTRSSTRPPTRIRRRSTTSRRTTCPTAASCSPPPARRSRQAILLDEGKPQFSAQDEARQEPAFVLQVMNADGTGVHQISFNQSHDRDATVLANGRVLWTRWDNAPGKDAMPLYSANPDGTDLELYYGANSHMTGTNNTVVEFVQPREMQDGRILALDAPVHRRRRRRRPGDHRRHPLRREHAAAGRQRRPHRPGADARHAQQRPHHPRPLAGRALQLRLPAVGWHRAASWSAGASAGCSTRRRRRRRSCRAPRPRLARSERRRWRRRCTACGCSTRRRTPCCRSCSPAEGVMITDVAVAQPRAAAEHHPRQGRRAWTSTRTWWMPTSASST